MAITTFADIQFLLKRFSFASIVFGVEQEMQLE